MSVRVLVGSALDVLRTLPSESVQCVVTSPPYFGLRDYGVDGQIGLERTPAEFIENLLLIFAEVRRVLRPDGLCFVNIGDSYAGSGKGPSGSNGIGGQEQRQGFVGSKQHTNAGSLTIGSHEHDYRGIPAKNLLLIPQRFAVAMQDDGWIVRSCISWCKTSAMPESVRDRPTSAWEPIWMFAKSASYFFDQEAGRGFRSSEGPAGIVQQANLVHQGFVFGQHFRLGTPPPTRLRPPSGVDHLRLRIEDAVYYATAILQGAELECDFGLSSLDPQVRKQFTENASSVLITGAPVVHGAAIDTPSLLDAHRAAEQLLEQIDGLTITLPDGYRFRIDGSAPQSLPSPEVGIDRDASVGVNHASKVGQIGSFTHNKEYTITDQTSRGANVRNYWVLGPEPSRLNHYASYPTEIVKRCVLLATSDKGACPACGAPWTRVVERTRYQEDRLTPKARALVEAGTHKRGTGLHETGWQNQPLPSSKTIGWASSCRCAAGDPVPCVVLDPFLGSGTTALVADRLGRDAIGIELNGEYAEMARRRLEQDAGSLFGEPVTVEMPRQLDIFGEASA